MLESYRFMNNHVLFYLYILNMLKHNYAYTNTSAHVNDFK